MNVRNTVVVSLFLCFTEQFEKNISKKLAQKSQQNLTTMLKKWRKIAHFYLVYEWIYNDSFTQNNVYLWYCIEPERVIIYLLSLRQARKSHNFFFVSHTPEMVSESVSSLLHSSRCFPFQIF